MGWFTRASSTMKPDRLSAILAIDMEIQQHLADKLAQLRAQLDSVEAQLRGAEVRDASVPSLVGSSPPSYLPGSLSPELLDGGCELFRMPSAAPPASP